MSITIGDDEHHDQANAECKKHGRSSSAAPTKNTEPAGLFDIFSSETKSECVASCSCSNVDKSFSKSTGQINLPLRFGNKIDVKNRNVSVVKPLNHRPSSTQKTMSRSSLIHSKKLSEISMNIDNINNRSSFDILNAHTGVDQPPNPHIDVGKVPSTHMGVHQANNHIRSELATVGSPSERLLPNHERTSDDSSNGGPIDNSNKSLSQFEEQALELVSSDLLKSISCEQGDKSVIKVMYVDNSVNSPCTKSLEGNVLKKCKGTGTLPSNCKANMNRRLCVHVEKLGLINSAESNIISKSDYNNVNASILIAKEEQGPHRPANSFNNNTSKLSGLKIDNDQNIRQLIGTNESPEDEDTFMHDNHTHSTDNEDLLRIESSNNTKNNNIEVHNDADSKNCAMPSLSETIFKLSGIVPNASNEMVLTELTSEEEDAESTRINQDSNILFSTDNKAELPIPKSVSKQQEPTDKVPYPSHKQTDVFEPTVPIDLSPLTLANNSYWTPMTKRSKHVLSTLGTTDLIKNDFLKGYCPDQYKSVQPHSLINDLCAKWSNQRGTKIENITNQCVQPKSWQELKLDIENYKTKKLRVPQSIIKLPDTVRTTFGECSTYKPSINQFMDTDAECIFSSSSATKKGKSKARTASDVYKSMGISKQERQTTWQYLEQVTKQIILSTYEKKDNETVHDRKRGINMIKELSTTAGYIADKIVKESDNLYDDPSKLAREDRALQASYLK